MNKRILFVDDDLNVLQGLQRILHPMREEWDLTFAESATKGLELMEQSTFDVVVSDMRMPGMNGAALLQEVMQRYPSTIRLVLSGHSDWDVVAQCLGVAHQYISKPCDPEQLKTVLRNACLLGGALLNEDVKRIISSMDRLPSIPALYQQLKKALEDENVGSKILGDIIQQDMGMTAKILTLVNSAFFGLRRTIVTPHEAVALLGIETIKTLVLSNGIFVEAHRFRTRAISLDDLWQHNLTVARDSKALAKVEHAERSVQEEAFVGGILHDVGILIMASNFPSAYDRVAEIVIQEKVSIPTAEQSEFGVSHAEVGAYLLELWGIPPQILEIVSMHHRPGFATNTGFSALLAVHAADVLTGKHGQYPLFGLGQLDEPLLARLSLQDHAQTWERVVSSPSEF